MRTGALTFPESPGGFTGAQNPTLSGDGRLLAFHHQIGGSFFIDHGTGVVIGATAVIGERVRLYQAVTLGARSFPADDKGVLIKGRLRHPIVEDDVVIYAGATILGRITIGQGSVIGGNVWLTHSVLPNSHITQAQLREDERYDRQG